MSKTNLGSVGIFIPTIFARPSLIVETVNSILAAAPKSRKFEFFILAEKNLASNIPPEISDQRVKIIDSDTIIPLPKKIQYGLSYLSTTVDYQCWIGDDDLLDPNWLEIACLHLDRDENVLMVYGDCQYIGPEGDKLFLSSPGQLAQQILNWGPDLIPQPSSVWRSSAFTAVGGIDESFNQAFDFDLFLRLNQRGKLHYINTTGSSFRWHPSSLSVKNRGLSSLEAVKVRWKNANLTRRLTLPLTEPFIFSLTWAAGKISSLIVSFRTRKNHGT